MAPTPRSAALPALLLAGLSLALSGWRLSFPDSLDDAGQGQQGLYVLDILENGRLMLPREKGEVPASKPPLYNWAAAAASLALGGATELSIKLPAALSGAGVVAGTVVLGAGLFGVGTGALAGLVLLSVYHFGRLSVLARTDMMLALWVLLALIQFHRAAADEAGGRRSAVWGWVFLALATLTKGPVGLAVALVGVLAWLLLAGELRRIGRFFPLPGVVLLLVVVAAWFALALREGGDAFYRRVVVNEMWERVTGTGERAERGRPFYYYVPNFLARFTPFSLFTFGGLWLLRRPPPEVRRGFTLLAGWFLGGFLFFSLSSGKRFDYLLPLYPAAALLAALPFTLAASSPPMARAVRGLGLAVAGLILLAAGAVLVLAIAGPPRVLAARATTAPFARFLEGRAVAVTAAAAALGWGGVLAATFLRRRFLAGAAGLAAGAMLAGAVHVALPTAEGRQDGIAVREFAGRLRTLIRPGASLEFYALRSKALLFHLGRLQDDLPDDRLEAAVEAGVPVVTNSEMFEKLRAGRLPSIRALETSGPRVRDEGRRMVLFVGPAWRPL